MSDQPAGQAGPRRNSPVPMVVRATKLDVAAHPDKQRAANVVLSNGPRSYREATYWVIRDRHTKQVHHESVVIKTYRKRKGKLDLCDRQHSVTLSTEADDDLQRLVDFITTCRGDRLPEASGNYVVLKTTQSMSPADLQRGIDGLSAAGKGDVVANLLRQSANKPELIEALLQHAETDPLIFSKATAALNLARFRRGADELKLLIGSSTREQDFQTLLGKHPWMFGSEYSNQLDRRKWTRDENADFMLRRTTDGYLELIEIKTPGPTLFNYDNSHKCHYPSVALSAVLGQVQNYIEKLDRDRDRIKANDREDTAKIRSKIIIGRDGDAGQVEALRRLNGHLHRIEVITFDQLLRVAQRLVGHVAESLSPTEGEPMPDAGHLDVLPGGA